MLKVILILPALALAALGVHGLSTADPSSRADFVIAGLELTAAVVLLGLAFVLGGAKPAAAASGDSDRAEVIDRLQRHTDALRAAEEEVNGVPTAPEPVAPEESPSTAGAHADIPASLSVKLPPLMLLKVGASATAADIESAPSLGSRDEVLARLRDIVPDLKIDSEGRAQHAGPDHAIRLDLGSGAEVHTVVVDAAGRTGISFVRWFLESTGWRAFVPKLGQFIEPDALEDVAIREE